MKATRKELAEAIMNLFDAETDPHEAASSVAAYLIAERRTGEINALLREVEDLRFRKDDVLEVHAESRHGLSAEAKQQIRELFKAKKVQINEEVNPELIGGVRVRALDKVADFSVQARLRRLRSGK